MRSQHRTERIAGSLMPALAAALVAIAWVGGEGPFNTSLSGREALQAALDHSGLLALHVAVSLLAGAIALALAASFYVVFRTHGLALSLLGALGLLVLSSTFFGMAVAGVALARISMHFEGASGAAVDDLASSAYSIAQLAYSSWQVGWHGALPLALFPTGVLIIRSKTLPLGLGWLAVAGGLLLVAGALVLVGAIAFGTRGPFWMVGPLGMLVALLWLFVAGLWLVAWGTREAQSATMSSEEVRTQ